MRLKYLINKFDKLLCAYLGLEREDVKPLTIKLKQGEMSVYSSLPYKRQTLKNRWEDFATHEIPHLNTTTLEQLGLALGATLAKDLVISFEESTIKKK